MKIQLKNTRVESFTFRTNEDIQEDNLEFGFLNGYLESEPNFFAVKFEVKMQSEYGYEFELQYVAQFKTDEEITDSFMESTFPLVNAPAIAYPYLRSFVSLITLNSGFDPLILPTVNFQAMAKAHKEKALSLDAESEVEKSCSQKE